VLKIFSSKTILYILICFSTTTIFFFSLSTHSKILNVSQYVNIAKGKSYTLNTAPNYTLCTDTDDNTQLTDGVYTSGYFWAQKTTVGWQDKRPVIITIDLGKIEPICGFSFNTAAGIYEARWPKAIYILVSDDGKNYHYANDLTSFNDKHDVPPDNGYAVYRYWTDRLTVHGRYVQFIINPGGRFCFIDEIEIYQGNNSLLRREQTGAVVNDPLDYFQKSVLAKSIRSRLSLDIKEAREDIQISKLPGNENAALSTELNDIEQSMLELAPPDPKLFSTLLPINKMEEQIFAVHAKIRRLKGQAALKTWVSHPLDYISPTQDYASTLKNEINLAMMRGEYRSAVFNITNSSSTSDQIKFSINGLPGGDNPDYISVYEVQWTDTEEFKPIAAALKLVPYSKSGYSTVIPSGMTRQIWLSFHPVNIEPGNYNAIINIKGSDGKNLNLSLIFHLFPIIFPQKLSLHAGGWDYTDSDISYGVTSSNRDALITSLKEHFVDSPWAITSRVMPFDSFVYSKVLVQKPDTSRFDTWIKSWPNARRYCVAFTVGDLLASSKMDTPDFNAKVKSWIDFWVNHAESKGIKPEQLMLALLDEPHENKQDRIIIAWANAIHAAQPKVRLWEDPIYSDPKDALPEMMSSVDILCPNRTQLLSGGKHFTNFYLNQKAEGRQLELYSCKGPMLLLDPYSYIRLQAWSCWEIGAESTSFWSFSDTGGGNPWNLYIAPRVYYSPLFLAPDSVTSGKHMEALRESVEDFEYFVMLKDAISKADPDNSALPKAKELVQTGARRVFEAKNASQFNWINDKDRWVAEDVRFEILKNLVSLGYAGNNQ
jgi:hypothetical protein